MDPIPVTPSPAPGAAPSNSTIGSSIGGSIAVVSVSIAKHYGWDIDSVTAVALAAIFTALCGYLPASGRR